MLAVGIDVGSTATKAVLLDGQGLHYVIRPTGWSPRQVGSDAMNELLQQLGYDPQKVDIVVATGYGRNALAWADKTVTEITCHARGAAYLVPGCDLVVDIGGQDSKVIKIDEHGKVIDFMMNDKCAAGTGRFLQVMAAALGLDVGELARSAANDKPASINNMCTVFAESEVIGLLAQGVRKSSIVAGLHASIAKRIASMINRVGIGNKIAFTGGVALNEGVQKSLAKELGVSLAVPAECQLVGALGAALIGQEQLLNTRGE